MIEGSFNNDLRCVFLGWLGRDFPPFLPRVWPVDAASSRVLLSVVASRLEGGVTNVLEDIAPDRRDVMLLRRILDDTADTELSRAQGSDAAQGPFGQRMPPGSFIRGVRLGPGRKKLLQGLQGPQIRWR